VWRSAGSGLFVAACAATLAAEPFDDALRRAERQERDARFDEAAASYGRAAAVCERAADCALARFRRARMLDRAGREREAVAEYLRAADADRAGPYRGQAWMYAARAADALGREDEAEALLSRVVFERSDEGIASRALAALADRRPPPERIAWLTSLEARLADTELGDHVLLMRSRLRGEAGDRAGERADLETLVSRHPFPAGQLWDDALWRLADMDEADGDVRSAIGRLRTMIDVHESSFAIGSYALPRMDDAALRIARLQLEVLRDPRAAVESARTLRDRFEDSELRDDAYWIEIRAWKALGEAAEACDVLSDLRDEYPESRFLRPDRAAEAGIRCGE
jgi:tetratricopeptide (TPR) repeat protein